MQSVELTWQGGEHSFQLRIDELRALQQKCDAGPEFILNRLVSKRWLVEDVTETIRLGLEGGGMDKDDARKLSVKTLTDEPLAKFVMTAQVILANALYGVEDDPVGELEAGAEENKTSHSREENTDGPDFTDQAS